MNRLLLYLFPFFVIGIAFAGGGNLKEISPDPAYSGGINSQFVLPRSQNEQEGSSKSNLYLQFNASGLFPSLADWKNQLHLSDGTHPSSSCIVFGGECGCVIYKIIQIGVGYEFFFTTKVSTRETSGDQVSSTFFYGSFKIGTMLESIPELYLFGSLDIGSISATEAMENYIVQNFEKTGTTTAYRLMIGAQYYTIDNWSITAGTGYLFGKVSKVTASGQPLPNFSLDLSGFMLRVAINYHIPI
jgi:hypothetical protein